MGVEINSLYFILVNNRKICCERPGCTETKAIACAYRMHRMWSIMKPSLRETEISRKVEVSHGNEAIMSPPLVPSCLYFADIKVQMVTDDVS